MQYGAFPARRMRRMRATPELRTIARETLLMPRNLALPIFIGEGEETTPLPGFGRGVSVHCLRDLPRVAEEAAALGLCALLLFPRVPEERKDALGSEADRKGNLMARALEALSHRPRGLAVVCDVALDPYTLSGHDGVLSEDQSQVDNDLTLKRLREQAVFLADHGADVLAPSDMMDGRIGVLRAALDEAGHASMPLLAYSAKFASACYGPFRSAVGSRKPGGYIDKRGYQMDPANGREAVLEAMLDAGEGADMLMVKPAGPYLDVIRAVKESVSLPLWAYQVSGEYAMYHHAAAAGAADFTALLYEHTLACRRAGADIVISYGAALLARAITEGTYPS